MKYKKALVVFFSLIFMISCSSAKHSVVPAHELKSIDPQVDLMARGSGNIRLLQHQLVPIDYLHRNPQLKGLLINHYMGTGKTYLGIGFAQVYRDKPVIILAPKFLESQWLNSIESYGAYNPKRFEFVSYDDAPEKLINRNLSNHIILADEVHNLIKLMRSLDEKNNNKYTKVYLNLRNAYKILGLTGTPIYNDESDLSFIINLVSGKDLMPFNSETFRLEYTKILPARQFFRGYVMETNLFTSVFALIANGIVTAFTGDPFLGFIIGMPTGIFLPVTINYIYSLDTYKLREINLEKMSPIMNKYISYFKFDERSFKDFPDQNIQIVGVPYNRQQYSFFLHLVYGDLPTSQLQRLLKDNKIQQSDEFVVINSSNIHNKIYNQIGAGRDIGNFDFVSNSGDIIEPPKFEKIYENFIRHNEQSVIYSNYYETGSKAFAEFLRRKNYPEKFAIIHPGLSVTAVNDIVSDYNQEKIKLLILHPDVTEGISLKGTQYLYILEPILNSTTLEQVIGRTRRFQSHIHLPKDKQTVNVFIYKSTSSNWNPEIGDIKRANWYKRYRELNYLSRWGFGLGQIDKKMDSQEYNPDEMAIMKLKTIERNLGEMQKILTKQSIENDYKLSK